MNLDKDLYFLLLIFRNNLFDSVFVRNLYSSNSLYSVSSLVENLICNARGIGIKKLENELDIHLKFLNDNGINIISFKDRFFPKDLLKISSNSRPFLYYKGNLNLLANGRLNVGIVGTRFPSLRAKRYCKQIANEVYNRDCNIVSGFAKGIDTIAQSQNLDKNIFVIPSGFSYCYPAENQKFLQKINQNLDKNLILTPFHFEEPINIINFRERNKIIASISNKLIVIESNVRSGSLMTARYTNLLEKDIYTISNLSSKGNEFLLNKMNAKEYRSMF